MRSLYNCSFRCLTRTLTNWLPVLTLIDTSVEYGGQIISSMRPLKFTRKKKNLKIWDADAIQRPGVAQRVMDEYFARDKVHI